jgi:hypothetical protein
MPEQEPARSQARTDADFRVFSRAYAVDHMHSLKVSVAMTSKHSEDGQFVARVNEMPM